MQTKTAASDTPILPRPVESAHALGDAPVVVPGHLIFAVEFSERDARRTRVLPHTAYSLARARFDGIEASAGKGTFPGLIPGLRDFDGRFIVRTDMSPNDRCRMTVAFGKAHGENCRGNAFWSRNLEHLPWINLSWEELSSEQTFSRTERSDLHSKVTPYFARPLQSAMFFRTLPAKTLDVRSAAGSGKERERCSLKLRALRTRPVSSQL